MNENGVPVHLKGSWTNVSKMKKSHEIWISILKPKKIFC